jgi:hypothetical protein
VFVVYFNKSHYPYFYAYISPPPEKGFLGFTRLSEGAMAQKRLRTPALNKKYAFPFRLNIQIHKSVVCVYLALFTGTG